MKELFYYTKIETLIHILRSFQIKMSVLSKSSDLRERNFYRSLVDPYKGVGDTEAKVLADKNTYVCFCTEPNESEWFHMDKGYRLPIMWDTYADRNRGACLIVDHDAFCKENSDLKESIIQYLDDIQLKESEDKGIEEKIKTKPKVFENEHEVRFISDSGKEYCSIKSSLRQVLLGQDYDKTYIPDTEKTSNSKEKLFDLIKSRQIHGCMFIQPIINKNGKMIKCENGNLLWKEMSEYGINIGDAKTDK